MKKYLISQLRKDLKKLKCSSFGINEEQEKKVPEEKKVPKKDPEEEKIKSRRRLAMALAAGTAGIIGAGLLTHRAVNNYKNPKPPPVPTQTPVQKPPPVQKPQTKSGLFTPGPNVSKSVGDGIGNALISGLFSY